MGDVSSASRNLRFGVFEVDLQAGELRRQGVKIKLQNQPFRILTILLEQAGEVVTRQELERRLWPGNHYGDFEHSISMAVKRLREALGDEAENPRFVETLPRHGYRFIYPVEPVAVVYDRRKGPALAEHRYMVPRRWVMLVGTVTAFLLVAVLLALNVAGLRNRILGTRAAPKIQSIAVLPLENLSGDPEQEYFADGMTEQLITDLGQISALSVRSRNSVMPYKDQRKPTPEIARELNVDGVVEGAVMRAGGRVRITAQLIEAKTDRHLWARTYERDLRDVLALQSEVAQAIANEVQAKLTPQEQARLARARPVDPEAHELYLKANYSVVRRDYYKAIEYFEQAIKKDPNFAGAHVRLGASYYILAENHLLPAGEAAVKWKAAVEKALELDDNLAEAHLSLAGALLYADWDWAGCEREFQRALELNPNYDTAHALYARHLMRAGRTEEAFAHARLAQEADPLARGWYSFLGWLHYLNHQYDQALEQYQKELESNPKADLHFQLACAYREKGMHDEAIGEFLQTPDGVEKFAHLGNAYARAGHRAEAYQAIQKLIELSKKGVGHYEVAVVYAGLDEEDRAFVWLEKACEVRDRGLLYVKVDPPLDPLRSDPRFQDLLRRMNFPQ